MAATKPSTATPRRSGRDRKQPDLYSSTTFATTGRGRGIKKVTKTKTAAAPKAKTAAPPKRKTTVKDKVEGAVKKAEGAVTKNPAKKAAGTKQMKGTDGKKRGRPAKK